MKYAHPMALAAVTFAAVASAQDKVQPANAAPAITQAVASPYPSFPGLRIAAKDTFVSYVDIGPVIPGDPPKVTKHFRCLSPTVVGGFRNLTLVTITTYKNVVQGDTQKLLDHYEKYYKENCKLSTVDTVEAF